MITAVSDIPYDKKRQVFSFDDGERVIIFKVTAKEYGLGAGRDVSSDEVKRIAKEGEEHIAFTTAIDALSRGLKSQNEIKTLLRQKKFSAEAAEVTISKLLGYNYLGDREYAEAYLSYKGSKTGRRKILYELVTVKGIDKAIAESAVYEILDDETELEKALSAAEKYIEKEKKKRTRLKERTYSFLAARGFDSEIIASAMSRLNFDGESDF